MASWFSDSHALRSALRSSASSPDSSNLDRLIFSSLARRTRSERTERFVEVLRGERAVFMRIRYAHTSCATSGLARGPVEAGRDAARHRARADADRLRHELVPQARDGDHLAGLHGAVAVQRDAGRVGGAAALEETRAVVAGDGGELGGRRARTARGGGDAGAAQLDGE